MSTRDLFSSGYMSYTSSQYPSEFPMGMRDRCFGTGSGNDDFVDEEPPPAPLALSSYSALPPPKYRTIQPRLSECGSMPKTPDDTAGVKPRRQRRSEKRWNRQRQPQGKNGEFKPVQLEADASMVSFTRPRSESFVPVSQYTDPGLFSSSQGTSLAPCAFSASNDLTSPESRLPLFPNGASEALVTDRAAYHHNVPCSLDSSDIQDSWPNTFFELSQGRDPMRAACVQFAEHLEKTQVLQSLSIVQDYMEKYPSVFEIQAAETVQKWILDVKGVKLPGSLSE